MMKKCCAASAAPAAAVAPVAPVVAAALPPEVQNASCWTGKHSSPEGQNSAKNEPKRCLTSVLKL